MKRILTIGNCQSRLLANILRSYFREDKVDNILFNKAFDNGIDFNEWDYIFLQNVGGIYSNNVKTWSLEDKVWQFPNVIFSGYQPDYVYVNRLSSQERIPNQSSILLNSYFNGISIKDAINLFNPCFVSLLNYDEYFEFGKSSLVSQMNNVGMDGQYFFDKWNFYGPFMYTINHPNLMVAVDIANHLCKMAGLKHSNFELNASLNDTLKDVTIFPSHNVSSQHINRLTSNRQFYKIADKYYSLQDFAELSYQRFQKWKSDLVIDDNRYIKFKKALLTYSNKETPKAINPYINKTESNFWKTAITKIKPLDVSALSEISPCINASDKIATGGSCFAQHIARTLAKNGLNYYVAEIAPESLSDIEAQLLGYGLFSARYGNIYTARQLLQLFKRAYGSFDPDDKFWISKSGKYLDPFRPNIGEEFGSEEEVIKQRDSHLAFVRKMFRNLDIFVFTLGLTECWVNTFDGAVYPVAPGVVSKHADYSKYEFLNFNHAQTQEDIVEFIGLLRSVNSKAKVILTVSPVPLIATYENEHVLSATIYSKSVLRAVAGELSKSFGMVSYFPSYEIITGTFNKGAYFEDDLRSIKPDGVEHVMRIFMDQMIDRGVRHQFNKIDYGESTRNTLSKELESIADTICDEELIVDGTESL